MIDLRDFYFKDDGSIPNNQNLPLVLYRQALSDESINPTIVKQLLNRNGWTGTWVNGIYSYHHYHSTAQEVLVITQGRAEVIFGGEQGKAVRVQAGDLVVIPAGVGHCLLESNGNFQVVGAYPDGQNPDLCTGKADERPGVLENINSVPLPEADPVTGEEKPLLEYWK